MLDVSLLSEYLQPTHSVWTSGEGLGTGAGFKDNPAFGSVESGYLDF